jgi:hypothetical protein
MEVFGVQWVQERDRLDREMIRYQTRLAYLESALEEVIRNCDFDREHVDRLSNLLEVQREKLRRQRDQEDLERQLRRLELEELEQCRMEQEEQREKRRQELEERDQRRRKRARKTLAGDGGA